jgi:peptide/nickel transport system permease protein
MCGAKPFPANSTAAAAAINDGLSEFNFEGKRYRVDLVHRTYNIKTDTVTHVLDMYRAPDAEHLLGTDQNGMDMLTRLMYGGRISLMVGFVVIFLEMFIGIIIGGISGYFGKWVDTMLMRFIDLFNCIPFWPILIIIGSVMDTLEVDSYVRIFLLMIILGLLGWTGIARVVRGQILALREQDFMVATEATGVRISRRIIRHLVPNVMPLLIVQATLGLGGIILTEATLSFLGLGVKYPLASWGSIINAASNPYIVTNFWFIWVPAGLLILLTVLGFNFVGDGLRDAFDPKMKR